MLSVWQRGHVESITKWPVLEHEGELWLIVGDHTPHVLKEWPGLLRSKSKDRDE